MRLTRILPVLMLAALGLGLTPASHAGFGDFLKDAKQAVGLGGGLSDSKITKGLKEALEMHKQCRGYCFQDKWFLQKP